MKAINNKSLLKNNLQWKHKPKKKKNKLNKKAKKRAGYLQSLENLRKNQKKEIIL